MKKRLSALLLIMVLILSALVFPVFSFNDTHATLEAPQNVNAYYNDTIILRWTVPQSIANAINNHQGLEDLCYYIDWKVNDGPWHYDVPKINSSTYGWDTDEDVNLFGWVGGKFMDKNNVQEQFFTHWNFGYNTHEEIYFQNAFCLSTR
jgi:hypothetical protein